MKTGMPTPKGARQVLPRSAAGVFSWLYRLSLKATRATMKRLNQCHEKQTGTNIC